MDPQAFPTPAVARFKNVDDDICEVDMMSPGMSVRDYFAGEAILLLKNSTSWAQMPSAAYALADQMLEMRRVDGSKDGGPAFPTPAVAQRPNFDLAIQEVPTVVLGLSLWDYFFTKALAVTMQPGVGRDVSLPAARVMAERMIRAREK